MSTSNWYDSLPTPTSTPARISVEDVHAMMADQVKVAGRDFVIVDVRRNDIEVRGGCLLDLATCAWGTVTAAESLTIPRRIH